MRIGVYSDMVYRRDRDGISNNRAFIRFVTALPPRVDEVVLFGRLDPMPGRSPYAVPHEGVRLVALPHYRSVTAVPHLLASLHRSTRIFAAELDRLDAIWIFGPHPVAQVFAWIARRRGTPVILGVRQDYPEYIANRLPSRLWAWAVPAARALDLAFRRLARTAPTVVLGSELARKYGGADAVISSGFSLVRRQELVTREAALEKPWAGERRILSVSRLDPEKNPLLLLDVLSGLRAHDERWRMVVAGEGPLRGAMEQRVRELGLQGSVELPGEVPNGPALWELYRRSHVFLHVSLTEGLPQVLFEAQAAGTPIVATAVGGVREALAGGASGLLIGPEDAGAAIAAVERLAGDAQLRSRLIAAALENAEHETLEAQLDRLVEFFRAQLGEPAAGSDSRRPIAVAAPPRPSSSQK